MQGVDFDADWVRPTWRRTMSIVASGDIVFVVADLTHPGQRVLLAAVLQGSTIAEPRYLTNLGREGDCLAYTAAIGSKRRVHLSNGFKTRHPALTNIIQLAVALPSSKWQLIELNGFLRSPRYVWTNKNVQWGV